LAKEELGESGKLKGQQEEGRVVGLGVIAAMSSNVFSIGPIMQLHFLAKKLLAWLNCNKLSTPDATSNMVWSKLIL